MAAVYISNLSVNVGATFDQSFTLADASSDSALDLTGYAHSAALRKHFLATTSTPFQTTVTDAAGGVISVSMGSTLTSTLKPGRYVYDLVIETGGTRTRVVEGTVLVRGGVTR
jgi:hypothetical protein|tara:strand:- start:4329 stop:4667 length:339 start_codon:yes stop_codon:yes gene_type:complete